MSGYLVDPPQTDTTLASEAGKEDGLAQPEIVFNQK
jgi:hypothetical protein